MKRVGVVLSGCGVFDGSEIHESVLTLLAIDKAGAKAICMAPDAPQAKVTDHYLKEDLEETRNILAESARIARGDIVPLAEARAVDLDAVILPGGYGAALNLSDFATRGAAAEVREDLARLLLQMVEQRKPIAALCIAPATLAVVLAQAGISARLTIGRDRDTAVAIEAMGHRHVDCSAGDIVVDEERRIVTSPAYMTARRISEVAEGIDKVVAEVLRGI